MTLSRRMMLKSTAIVTASLAASAKVAAAQMTPTLVVFDSRIPASMAFAQTHSAPRMDVAHADAHFWRDLRGAAPHGPIIGLIGWSDWVVVRGLLEEKGKRLTGENRAGQLFHWTMV
ncbi:MAG: hypothetical protein RLY97_102 [Pseudomonadota bacterium]